MENTTRVIDRIRASASDRESLHAKLAATQFDPTALERQLYYTRELGLQVRQLRKRADDARKEMEGARKEQDRRGSALHVLGSKIRRKSADARAEADRNSSETLQHSFQLERECQDLEDQQRDATKELETIQETGAAYVSLLNRLDQVYEKIFTGTGATVQQDRELQEPVLAARRAAQHAEQSIQVEDSVMDSLRMANTKFKSMVGPLSEMLASSQWQGWSMGNGASGTFANEDGNMGKILANIDEGDACIQAARAKQPKVEAEKIAVDTEGTSEKHIFRRLVWDPRLLTKMEGYVMKMRRSEKVLRAEIDKAYLRKRQAEEDKFSAEREVSLTREKLVEGREALIHEICQ
jgi:hypothetical protein